MRLQLLSDLHLESHPDFQFHLAEQVDVLVLAGDIGSYQPGSALRVRQEPDFGLRRFSPQAHPALRRRGPDGVDRPLPVLFVPGNHEFDGLPYHATRARLRETCERLGIVWLDEQVLVIDGVRFIGSTLWADFDALASDTALRLKEQGRSGGSRTGQPTRKTLQKELREARAAMADPVSDLTRRLREREKAFRAANFYLSKNTTLDDGSTQAPGAGILDPVAPWTEPAPGSHRGAPMLAQDLRPLALSAQAWLHQALSAPHEGPTVVVTHFAPSLLSADPRYGLSPGTAGFCNALDPWLPMADLWLHGHLHCTLDYTVEGPRPDGSTGRCRVVAHPLGYADKGEQEGFDPSRVIEVPERPPALRTSEGCAAPDRTRD